MAYISFQPTDFFSSKIYTGTGGASQAQTGLGFQPDLVWIKARTAAESNTVWDAVRGVQKGLYTNNSSAEATISTGLLSFDSDGFTVGSEGKVGSSYDYASWSWKAGTTTGIDTTGSTITPTAYSFNQTSGVSIIQYDGNNVQGATVPHGLGAAPQFILIKARDATESWATGHHHMNFGNPSVTGWDYYMYLNTTAPRGQNNNRFGNVNPTSTVFSIGNDDSVNDASYTYMAYCFAPKKGFSSFGSYVGNLNDDGPFIYTGFRPAFTITKPAVTDSNSWYVLDRLRANPYNPQDGRLEADGAGTESTGKDIDYVANGFKIRKNDGGMNNTGITYIYAAFAEFPFVSSNSKPGTAR